MEFVLHFSNSNYFRQLYLHLLHLRCAKDIFAAAWIDRIEPEAGKDITRGLSNAQIALQLDISAESVKTHMTKLFSKLGAANRSEAVAIALRKHLLKI